MTVLPSPALNNLKLRSAATTSTFSSTTTTITTTATTATTTTTGYTTAATILGTSHARHARLCLFSTLILSVAYAM